MLLLSATFYLILLISAVPYLLVLLVITLGWFRIRNFNHGETPPHSTTVSIIVPARNESHTIVKCIEGLLNQDYPKQFMEIIVVDDHSEDQTVQLAEKMTGKRNEIRMIVMSLSEVYGKKEAIRHAMQSVSGELVLCTDADCVHPVTWVRTMAGFYAAHQPVFISGPVRIDPERRAFSRFQAVEFASLVAAGAGAIGAGRPVMCNGANLGFSSEAYGRLKTDAMKNEVSSGDDVFLMLAFRDEFGAQRISFIKSESAVVEAFAKTTFVGYMHQRLRWVSKSRAYKDPFLIMTAISVMIMNMAVVSTAVAGIFSTGFLWLALSLLVIKTLADLPLLVSYSRFSGLKGSIRMALLLEPLVVPLTAFTALAGHFVRISWKGRKIK